MSFESKHNNTAIQTRKLSKCYQLYNHPKDRLKQFLWRGKRKYYRELWALQDINFSVSEGEVVGIVGNNGSGKSTLLQLVCGTLTPTSGEIAVNGRIAALLELGAGFNPEFTGRENVLMNAAIMGLGQTEIAERFESIVDFSGIRDFIDQPVKTYSSGMYVRLAFSVAINVDPDILVIDEALSVGDGAFARKSFDRIMQFRKAGKTILFCSHSIYQVAALCDRAIWLDKGRIAMIGSSSDVTNQYGQTLLDTDSHIKKSTQPPTPSAQHTSNRGTARITDVQASVDGASGTLLHATSQKSTLTVAVQFDFDPELPTPSLAITFSTIDGLGISSTSSYHDNIDLTHYFSQDKMIEVIFPSIPLLKGDYTLSVYLGCENAIHCYDSALNIIQLKIEQEGTEQGFVMFAPLLETMIICYLLESTNLAGGVRVVFDQARLLTKRGHQVIIRARFGNHHWYHHPIDVDYVDNLASPFPVNTALPDIVIATFWTTVHAATQLRCRKAFHFCQGYEGDLPEYAGIHKDIEQAYRLPIPKLTVGDWLTKRLQQLYSTPDFTVHTIGQIVDTALFTPPKFMFGRWLRKLLRRPVKILLIGMFESSVKGIPDTLHAIRIVRKQNIKLHVTRVSSHALSEEEKTITPINSYLTQLPPQRIAQLYRTHDLMIAPSHAAEGFGLPFAEALASGLPCIATAIPSHLSFDTVHDYAVFVPPKDPQAMAQAILELLNNPHQQTFLRQRGPQLIRKRFSSNAAIEKLEQLCLESLNH